MKTSKPSLILAPVLLSLLVGCGGGGGGDTVVGTDETQNPTSGNSGNSGSSSSVILPYYTWNTIAAEPTVGFIDTSTRTIAQRWSQNSEADSPILIRDYDATNGWSAKGVLTEFNENLVQVTLPGLTKTTLSTRYPCKITNLFANAETQNEYAIVRLGDKTKGSTAEQWCASGNFRQYLLDINRRGLYFLPGENTYKPVRNTDTGELVGLMGINDGTVQGFDLRGQVIYTALARLPLSTYLHDVRTFGDRLVVQTSSHIYWGSLSDFEGNGSRGYSVEGLPSGLSLNYIDRLQILNQNEVVVGGTHEIYHLYLPTRTWTRVLEVTNTQTNSPAGSINEWWASDDKLFVQTNGTGSGPDQLIMTDLKSQWTESKAVANLGQEHTVAFWNSELGLFRTAQIETAGATRCEAQVISPQGNVVARFTNAAWVPHGAQELIDGNHFVPVLAQSAGSSNNCQLEEPSFYRMDGVSRGQELGSTFGTYFNGYIGFSQGGKALLVTVDDFGADLYVITLDGSERIRRVSYPDLTFPFPLI